MAVGTYYFDTATFANATTVYTDLALTLVAPNGFYSDDTIVREQINGQLQVAETCDCAGMPVSPSIFTVTQNVSNGITGVLGVDYTLSGNGYDGANPAGPLTQSGPELTLYSFIIDATPAAGLQFSVGAPFSATNPNGSIPASDTTVTNTLAGTIEPIPTPVVSSFYYRLTPCFPCDTNEYRYIGPDTVGPGDQQRFLDPNSGCYYKYVPGGFTNPPAVFINEDLLINAESIPGEFGCPVVTSLNYYVVRSCATNENYVMETEETYALNTRISYDQDLYIVVGNANGLGGGYTTLPTSPCVDEQNRADGDPGFTGCATDCGGSQYLRLAECTTGIQPITQSLNTAGFWYALGFAVNDYVYAPETQKCYQITSETTDRIEIIDLTGMNIIASCSQCTGDD